MKTLLRVLSVTGGLMLGCVSHSPQPVAEPDGAHDPVFSGAAANDFWAHAPLSHFDGSSWTKVTAPFGNTQVTAAAGPGKVWLVGGDITGGPISWRVVRVSAAGEVEDFTSQFPQLAAQPNLFSENGETVVVVNAQDLYRLDGDTFQKMPDRPAEAAQIIGARLFGKDDYLFEFSWQPPQDKETTTREQGTRLLRWKDGAWIRGTDNRVAGVSVTLAARTFPADNVWIRCSDPVLFDGSSYRTLGVPTPGGNCAFGYQDGHPAMAYPYSGGEAELRAHYGCDIDGNCQQLDVPTWVDSTWHAAQWNGAEWVNDREIGKIRVCVGAGCAYGAARRYGVIGHLEDGTMIFVGATDDGSGGPGGEKMWLVTP